MMTALRIAQLQTKDPYHSFFFVRASVKNWPGVPPPPHGEKADVNDPSLSPTLHDRKYH